MVSAFCKIINWLIYGFVTHAAARRAHIVSDVSKLEDWLMAHFEATLMHITNNHFKTLLKAIWGIYGPKTVKNSLKMSQIDNFPEFLAIKWERKVLKTQFWYQKKALTE